MVMSWRLTATQWSSDTGFSATVMRCSSRRATNTLNDRQTGEVLMHRLFLLSGAVFAALAVAAGAFGAHGLKNRLGPELLGVFETGVRYQMYHAPALILLAVLAARLPG